MYITNVQIVVLVPSTMSVEKSLIHLTNQPLDVYWYGVDAFFELASHVNNEGSLVSVSAKSAGINYI